MGGRQSFEQDLNCAVVSWDVPPWPRLDDSARPVITPTARRAYAVGEVVERVYCLELQADAFDGTYLETFCPIVATSDGQRARLFPFGWGLLYAPCKSGSNLAAEHCFASAPPPPGSDEGNSAVFDPSPCHWLVFRTTRAVAPGEPLCVAPLGPGPTPRADVMAAAAQSLGDEGFGLAEAAGVDEVDEVAPAVIGMAEQGEAAIVVGASPMQGVGVFAARDIEKGELLEVSPTLPVLSADFEGTALGHYTFQSDFSAEGISLLHLGFGCIYNHSDCPNVTHYKFEDQQPYVEAWIADRFIPAGHEIFHDYGVDYFKSRAMEQKSAPHERMNWRLVKRACC